MANKKRNFVEAQPTADQLGEMFTHIAEKRITKSMFEEFLAGASTVIRGVDSETVRQHAHFWDGMFPGYGNRIVKILAPFYSTEASWHLRPLQPWVTEEQSELLWMRDVNEVEIVTPDMMYEKFHPRKAEFTPSMLINKGMIHAIQNRNDLMNNEDLWDYYEGMPCKMNGELRRGHLGIQQRMDPHVRQSIAGAPHIDADWGDELTLADALVSALGIAATDMLQTTISAMILGRRKPIREMAPLSRLYMAGNYPICVIDSKLVILCAKE